MNSIIGYLEEEGLILAHRETEYLAKGIAPDDVSITHTGLKEVEQALEKPESPTAHFPEGIKNLVYIGGNVGHSNFMVESPNSQQTLINENQSEDLQEIIKLLNEFVKDGALDSNQKEEIQTDIKTLELQISSKRPKVSIIKDCLFSAKSILEGIAGVTAAAMPIVTRISSWLGGTSL